VRGLEADMDENADQLLPFITDEFGGDAGACLTKSSELVELTMTGVTDPYDKYLEEMATGEGMPEAPIRD
jgi:hypothetical protein